MVEEALAAEKAREDSLQRQLLDADAALSGRSGSGISTEAARKLKGDAKAQLEAARAAVGDTAAPTAGEVSGVAKELAKVQGELAHIHTALEELDSERERSELTEAEVAELLSSRLAAARVEQARLLAHFEESKETLVQQAQQRMAKVRKQSIVEANNHPLVLLRARLAELRLERDALHAQAKEMAGRAHVAATRRSRLGIEFRQLQTALSINEGTKAQALLEVGKTIQLQQQLLQQLTSDEALTSPEETAEQYEELRDQVEARVRKQEEREWAQKLAAEKKLGDDALAAAAAQADERYETVMGQLRDKYTAQFQALLEGLEGKHAKEAQRVALLRQKVQLLELQDKERQAKQQKLAAKEAAHQEQKRRHDQEGLLELNRTRDRVEQLWRTLQTPPEEVIAFLQKVEDAAPADDTSFYMYERKNAELQAALPLAQDAARREALVGRANVIGQIVAQPERLRMRGTGAQLDAVGVVLRGSDAAAFLPQLQAQLQATEHELHELTQALRAAVAGHEADYDAPFFFGGERYLDVLDGLSSSAASSVGSAASSAVPSTPQEVRENAARAMSSLEASADGIQGVSDPIQDASNPTEFGRLRA